MSEQWDWDPPLWKEIKFRCSYKNLTNYGRNTIYDVLQARGYQETDSDLDWDIFWCDLDWIREVFAKIHLQPHQRIPHFRNHFELTRKDLLIKNLKRAKRQAEKEGRLEDAQCYGTCCPTTFTLPREYAMFVEEFRKDVGPWIMKPVGLSQGKGIFLFDKLSQISEWKQNTKWLPLDEKKEQEEKLRKWRRRRSGIREDEQEEEKEIEPYVVQKYVSDPLLLGGKKFDLRLYVLVTSFAPMVVYMYRSGFARFSHTKFSMDSTDLNNAAVHLTNVSVQMNCDKYDERRGGKWDLHQFKLYLVSREGHERVDEMFCEIESIVLFSLLSVQQSMIQDKNCFELYGYDILISESLKPWLIEVNASPSLTATTDKDYDLKTGLLDDTLTVLDLEKYLTGTEKQLGGFDLLYKNGVRVGPPPSAAYRSYLGCHNNRNDQLKRLWANLYPPTNQDVGTKTQQTQQSSSYPGNRESITGASQHETPEAKRDPFQAYRRMTRKASLKTW